MPLVPKDPRFFDLDKNPLAHIIYRLSIYILQSVVKGSPYNED